MRRTRLFHFLTIVVFTTILFLAAPTSAHASIWDDWFGKNDANKNSDAQLDAENEGEKGFANLRHLAGSLYIDNASVGILHMLGPSKSGLAALPPEDRARMVARYGKGGALGSFTEGIVALYTPPASSVTYVADLLNTAHIIPQAQAQGLGFAALDPVLEVWKLFRNLAYLIFVILFLVIGFMIMFRQKIGQTAVTMQQAIPNIVVSLIFVTFSYAIAGLMIDLMYLVMYLLVGMFSASSAQDIMQYSIFDLGWSVLSGQNGAGVKATTAVWDNVDDVVKAAINMDGIGDAIGWLSGLTAAVIMAVAVLIAVFKLFFELLKTYITIVLSIAFAPLILMMGALPGHNAFKEWIVNLTGNLLAFPTTLLIIIIYRMFAATQLDTGGFLPPFLIGRGVAGTISTLVGVGIILIMPELIVEMKKAVGVKGSVFEQLGNSMVKNWGQGEVALPVLGGMAGGAAGGLYGAGNYLNDARKTKNFSKAFNWRDLGRAAKTGESPYSQDRDGNSILRGGVKRWGKVGYDRGQSMRKTIDRTKEGRILDAEDPAKMFSAFLEDKKEKHQVAKPTQVNTGA